MDLSLAITVYTETVYPVPFCSVVVFSHIAFAYFFYSSAFTRTFA